MYLTREEERILEGEHGWACQICMKILVKLGELFGATRLIPINSAHISGVSYKTIGDAPIEFLRNLVEKGAKTNVFSTLNPSSVDPRLASRLPNECIKKQGEILELYSNMNAKLSLSCTPYYESSPPKGLHLAWAESSAVVYANSVLGAWTNREGAPSALASAILGKTPDYGVHKPENRTPNILVRVSTDLLNEIDYGALGYYVGKIAKDKIPLFKGLKNPSLDCLKQLGAAMASSGMTNMFHYNEKTEANDITEKIDVGRREINSVIEELSLKPENSIDMVFVGCPHCSLEEIKTLARLVKGKRLKRNVEFWVCVSRHIKQLGKNFIDAIESSGATILTDTCAVVTWTEKLGIRRIMTNSVKAAHYLPTMNKAEVLLAPIEKCVKAAYT